MFLLMRTLILGLAQYDMPVSRGVGKGGEGGGLGGRGGWGGLRLGTKSICIYLMLSGKNKI